MLSHYRLVEKIGEGGMGVVWKAIDTTLDREVAIKVLPEVVAQDPDRLVRFEREAKLLASLNHPHIATIHGLHEVRTTAGGPSTRFLAMELVDGEDLAQRLSRGPLRVDDALEVAGQVAEALEAAHEHGIVHRDLKPANIKRAPDGTIKVLDFGLAKAFALETRGDSSSSLSPTVTSAGSVTGVIMGTAAYMSPEQARAKPVDGRTDVWAFGCVVYEMLTGKKAFPGESISDTLANVLKEEPDWSSLPAGKGEALRPALERCLRKDPRRRLHHPADARIDLEDAIERAAAGEGDVAPAGVVAPAGTAVPRWGVATIAVLGLLAMTTAALWLTSRSSGKGAGAPHVTVSQQTFHAGTESFPSLSPDGEFLAYSAEPDGGDTDIFLERVGGRNPINLTEDSDAADIMPAFSPDGRTIAFCSTQGRGGIFVMGATGESVRRLTDEGFDPAWSPDGERIAYATEGAFDPLARNRLSALRLVDVTSGETSEIFEGDAMQPSWSPNGHRIAGWSAYSGLSSTGQRDIFTIRSDGTDRVAVTDDVAVDWNPVWSADGRHLYFVSDRGGSMNNWRVPIDERSGRVLGDPEPVLSPAGWSGPIALGGDRTLAYVNFDRRFNISRVPYDPQANEITGPPEPVTSGTLLAVQFRPSPDGAWVVFRSVGVQEDLYLVHPDGSGLRKLTDDLAKDRGPSWTPDGERIVFYSNRGGRYEIWTIRLDGSELRQLTRMDGDESVWFPRISPDGRWLAAYNADGTRLLELTGEAPHSWAKGTLLPAVGEDEAVFNAGDWSPDGRYLGGNLVGSNEIPFWDVERNDYRLIEVDSEGGGSLLGWLPDGRAVVRVGSEPHLLDVESGSMTPLAEPPVPLGEDAGLPVPSPDGRWLYFSIRSFESDIWIAEIE
jgi:Tol biopolymer transport system component